MSETVAEKSFEQLAKKYSPREGSTLAYKHSGAPKLVTTEHGARTVHDGDYVVQVGETVVNEWVHPSDGKPGRNVERRVPKLEVVPAAEFEARYKTG